MRIGVMVLRVLLVAGLTMVVASPSFVDRRDPSLPQLLARFRLSNVHATYRGTLDKRDVSLYLDKAGLAHLRLRLRDAGGAAGPTDQLLAQVNPETATLCQPTFSGHGLLCSEPESPFGRQSYVEDLVMGLLGFPNALADAVHGRPAALPLAQFAGHRIIADRRSTCFRLMDDAADQLCFDDRGILMYSNVDTSGITIIVEATAVSDAVDMAVFQRAEN